MASMKRGSWFVALAFSLSCWMGFLGALPGEAFAGLIPSHGTGKAGSRDDDLRRVRSFLERELVQKKMVSYGVPHQVAMDKVKEMNDEDLHLLAAMTDRLPAGSGDEPASMIIGFVEVIAVAGAVVLVILVILGIIGIGYLGKYFHKISKSSEETKPSAPEPEPAGR